MLKEFMKREGTKRAMEWILYTITLFECNAEVFYGYAQIEKQFCAPVLQDGSRNPTFFFIRFDAVQGLTEELHWRRCFPDHDMLFGRMTGGVSGLRLVVCPASAYT